MTKVICNDGCQQEFNITELKTEGVDKLPGSIERYYIECPNCGQEYTSYYLDDDMKEMQAEIKRLLRKPSLKIKQKNRADKLKRKLQFRMNQLKMEVEHGNQNASDNDGRET